MLSKVSYKQEYNIFNTASAYKSKNVTVFIIDLLIDLFLYVARLRNGNYWWLLNFYQSPFT